MPGKAKQAAVKTFSSLINGLILMERTRNILGIYSGDLAHSASGQFSAWRTSAAFAL
jgi:hypothetical protein